MKEFWREKKSNANFKNETKPKLKISRKGFLFWWKVSKKSCFMACLKIYMQIQTLYSIHLVTLNVFICVKLPLLSVQCNFKKYKKLEAFKKVLSFMIIVLRNLWVKIYWHFGIFLRLSYIPLLNCILQWRILNCYFSYKFIWIFVCFQHDFC